jgi:hypothetical protein
MVSATTFANTGTVQAVGDNGSTAGGFVELNPTTAVVNNGTFVTGNTGGIGVYSPSFVNNGVVNIAGGNDDLEITSAYPGGTFSTPTVTTGAGAINLSGAGSRVRFVGTQSFSQGTINLTGAGATITDASVGVVGIPVSSLTLGAQSVINASATSADITSWYNSGNQIINNGAINANATGGTLTIDPALFANNGTISVSNGDHLVVKAATTGSGSVSLAGGASAEFGSNVASSETIAFVVGSNDLLKLDTPTTVSAAISGFAAGDTIDLAGVVATKATWANNALTITENTGAQFVLDVLGNYASNNSFALASDGLGGTDITLAASGALAGAFALAAAIEGTASSTTLATFTDSNPNDAASLFAATINWGDGTTSVGAVTALAGGGFSVSAASGHAYGAEGSYPDFANWRRFS